ncbi:hypothetical protein A5778_22345 [Mycolicibacterium monacense]|nr:hypothetical protein A5778_22345 [Mycolicibacterium monacense]
MRPGCPDGAPRWAVCGASVTGQEHERRGLGCDDAYSYGVAGDYVVAAVADGAGAVTGTSAWGAYAACQSVLTDALQPAFVENFRNGNADQLMRWLFDNALTRVTRQAAALGVEPMRLSTTLCVAVADHGRAVFGQIGDGVIAAELHDGRIGSLLIEEKDGYANTTSFLQSDRAFEESFRTISVDGVTAFALSTDGMSYKITDIGTGEAYEPFFRDSWQHVRAGARADQFAALLRGITDDQTGDDKTMVLAAVSGSAVGAVTDSSPAPETSVAELETVPLTRGARRRGLWRRRR